MVSEVVRVLRVIEYVGPREWVEATVRDSIQGTRVIDNGKGRPSARAEIRAATIGSYPEILEADDGE